MHIIIPILFLIICLIAIRFRKQKRIVFSILDSAANPNFILWIYRLQLLVPC